MTQVSSATELSSEFLLEGMVTHGNPEHSCLTFGIWRPLYLAGLLLAYRSKGRLLFPLRVHICASHRGRDHLECQRLDLGSPNLHGVPQKWRSASSGAALPGCQALAPGHNRAVPLQPR